jgi:predicted CoA-binding protein
MSADGLDDAVIREVLTTTRRIALIGASDNPARAAWGVLGFLLRRGYDVTPVNPLHAGQDLQGRRVVATLDEAAPLEMVDVFRASPHLAGIVEDAIRLGARIVWGQLGVVDHDAAARGRAAGLVMVMDRCPAMETRRLALPALT